MPPARSLRSNPVHLLVLAVVGFVGWVAYDANRPTPPPPADPGTPRFEPLQVGKLFASIRPGMPRPVVEEHLLDVSPVEVGPVDLTAGTVYHSRYRLYLSDPLPQAEYVGEFTPGHYLVTLFFDAQKTGHPLVRAVVTRAGAAPTGIPRAVAE